MKTSIVRLVREQFIIKVRKSSEPVKLGQSTPVIYNPSIKDSQNKIGDDWALSDNVSGAAAATLLPKTKNKNGKRTALQ